MIDFSISPELAELASRSSSNAARLRKTPTAPARAM